MIRRLLAGLMTAGFVAIAAGPFGCKPPEAPKPPDGVPEKKGGNCCFRDDRVTPTYCKGQDHCCNGDYDLDACESRGGLWFDSTEGCRGAC